MKLEDETMIPVSSTSNRAPSPLQRLANLNSTAISSCKVGTAPPLHAGLRTRKMKRFRALGAAGLLLATLLILFTAGCGRPRDLSASQTAPAVVAVETAERREVPIMVELAARTEAAAIVEIRAGVEGRLTEMSFQEGRLIEKGQMLFRIDPSRYEAAVQSVGAAVDKAEADVEMAREQPHLVNAQSALRQAQANLLKCDQDVARLKPLAARRAVPTRDLDTAVAAQSSAAAAVEDAVATVRTTAVGDRLGLRQAQAGLIVAQVALETAKFDRAQTEIRAPIGGLIGRAEVSAGNYVGRGGSNRLATISRVDPIHVVFGISETLYLRTVNTVETTALDRIELVLADNSVYPFRGRFTHLEGGVDERTGTLLAVAQFKNPKAVLLPGMTGRVRFAVGNRPGAVLVSEQALFDAQGSKAVYILTPEHKVAVRRVVAEGSYQGKSVVTAGLEGGEAVIVEGSSKLRPGQPARPQAARAARD
jgi:membrane fusion protein (multidrug efflux system)